MHHWTRPPQVAWVFHNFEMCIFQVRGLSYRSAGPLDAWANVAVPLCQHTMGLDITIIWIRHVSLHVSSCLIFFQIFSNIIIKATCYTYGNSLIYLKWPLCFRFMNIKTVIVPMRNTQTTQTLIIQGREVSAKQNNNYILKSFNYNNHIYRVIFQRKFTTFYTVDDKAK